MKNTPSGVELSVPLTSLGPILEWYVAEILQRELGFCVAWNLPLRGGGTGGDLDVVALVEGKLIYLEVKSGPPKHINQRHIAAFLERVAALAPYGAIFFEDTELRMTDKVLELFKETLAHKGQALEPPQRLLGEHFVLGDRLCVANAQPSIIHSLSLCINHLFRHDGMQLFMDLKSGTKWIDLGQGDR